MIDSRCGLHCTGCEYKETNGCKGCIETNGNPFHGECPVAVCCQDKGFVHCGQCSEIPCELLTRYSCDPVHGDNPHGARIEQCKLWQKITCLRMERQFLTRKANLQEYLELFRDTQPGQNVHWHGFGQPPTLSFRADFDDVEYNRERQEKRELIKGRFAEGNLGWILAEDLELFLALYEKPLTRPTENQRLILTLIQRLGPLNIQQIKEETGLLVKHITPALHRLQQAFLLYEDQYDGEWDRAWYPFEEMFPDIDRKKYTRMEALKIVLQRFTYRQVWVDVALAYSFYRLPEKQIQAALKELATEGIMVECCNGYVLRDDVKVLASYEPRQIHSVYALHRKDFLYKSCELALLERFMPMCQNLPYDHEPLQYLLIDGEFRGLSVGHFRYGPYDLNDIVCDSPGLAGRKEEILKAVEEVNGCLPQRFMGEQLDIIAPDGSERR